MNRKSRFSAKIRHYGAQVFVSCFLAKGAVLRGQEVGFMSSEAALPGGTNQVFVAGVPGRAGGIFINGLDIGSGLLKACDLDQNGTATLAEVKEVATACFKLWDTNSDASLTAIELSSALKEFFPRPVGIGVVNGAAVTVTPEDLPTPEGELARHVLAGADSNNDGLLSVQELNDFLATNFSQWDQDVNGSLDASELAMAFGRLSLPDGAVTAPAHLY